MSGQNQQVGNASGQYQPGGTPVSYSPQNPSGVISLTSGATPTYMGASGQPMYQNAGGFTQVPPMGTNATSAPMPTGAPNASAKGQASGPRTAAQPIGSGPRTPNDMWGMISQYMTNPSGKGGGVR